MVLSDNDGNISIIAEVGPNKVSLRKYRCSFLVTLLLILDRWGNNGHILVNLNADIMPSYGL